MRRCRSPGHWGRPADTRTELAVPGDRAEPDAGQHPACLAATRDRSPQWSPTQPELVGQQRSVVAVAGADIQHPMPHLDIERGQHHRLRRSGTTPNYLGASSIRPGPAGCTSSIWVIRSSSTLVACSDRTRRARKPQRRRYRQEFQGRSIPLETLTECIFAITLSLSSAIKKHVRGGVA